MAECIGSLMGGPTYYMPGVNGHDWPYEMHPHIGPCPLTLKQHREMAVKNEPPQFWRQWELFNLGGRVMDGDKCVVPEWCSECGGVGRVLEHIGGRHYADNGPCPACDGSRVVFPTG